MKRSFRFILCVMICLLFTSASFAEEPTPIKWGTVKTYYHKFHSVTVSHPLYFHPNYFFRDDYPYIRLSKDNPVSCTSPGWITYSDHEIHYFNTPTGGFNCYEHIKYYMEPLNHAGTVFSLLSDATCSANAKESGFCKHCSQTIIREIPDTQTDHIYETYAAHMPADCSNPATEIAYCKFACKGDGSSHIRSVGSPDPSAHNWNPWVPYENASHIRTCQINPLHQEIDPCETELNCSICGRTAQAPETGDHTYLMLWILFAALSVSVLRFRKHHAF